MQTNIKTILLYLLALMLLLFQQLCDPEKPLKIEPPPGRQSPMLAACPSPR